MRQWWKVWWDVWAAAVVSLIIVALCVFFAGCVSVTVLGDMPLPLAPQLTFQACQVAGVATICISEVDANKLRAYFDQLNAYRHAVDRLHNVVQ